MIAAALLLPLLLAAGAAAAPPPPRETDALRVLCPAGAPAACLPALAAAARDPGAAALALPPGAVLDYSWEWAARAGAEPTAAGDKRFVFLHNTYLPAGLSELTIAATTLVTGEESLAAPGLKVTAWQRAGQQADAAEVCSFVAKLLALPDDTACAGDAADGVPFALAFTAPASLPCDGMGLDLDAVAAAASAASAADTAGETYRVLHMDAYDGADADNGPLAISFLRSAGCQSRARMSTYQQVLCSLSGSNVWNFPPGADGVSVVQSSWTLEASGGDQLVTRFSHRETAVLDGEEGVQFGLGDLRANARGLGHVRTSKLVVQSGSSPECQYVAVVGEADATDARAPCASATFRPAAAVVAEIQRKLTKPGFHTYLETKITIHEDPEAMLEQGPCRIVAKEHLAHTAYADLSQLADAHSLGAGPKVLAFGDIDVERPAEESTGHLLYVIFERLLMTAGRTTVLSLPMHQRYQAPVEGQDSRAAHQRPPVALWISCTESGDDWTRIVPQEPYRQLMARGWVPVGDYSLDVYIAAVTLVVILGAVLFFSVMMCRKATSKIRRKFE